MAALAATIMAGTAAAATNDLPVPPALKTPVEYWKRIFGTYSINQVVIHDAWQLDRVYEVLDFRPLADSTIGDVAVEGYIRDKVQEEKERVRAILVRLHQLGPDPMGLSEEERKIWAMFADVKAPSKFLEAAAEDRIRGQRGLRERFAAGVEVSRRYLPEMEAVFRREGLPVALTRLPLVESCFNVHAYSKVGAAGIWQFMPSTGRLYLRIDDAVDERRDPVASTAAAAEHLKANYEVLNSWPLAITAYNHGRAGMVRAVSAVGSSDLAEIIEHYHGPAFKFASRNFYAEFLAALDVEQHFRDYFGELSPHRPLRTDSVTVPAYVSLKGLAQVTKTDVDTLADLNPGLTHEVVAGKLHVPKGYRLRVPQGAAADFSVRYASLSPDQKRSQQRSISVTHRVRKGQTLMAIAKRYRTTVAAIQRRNNLRGILRVRAGQSLIIPTG
jgi:membrane-bound lytic murein transglycosylase D